MPTSQEAKAKISAAQQCCERVFELYESASSDLDSVVQSLHDGFFIFNDRGADIRGALLSAQRHINAALSKLDSIEFPTDSDFDAL